MKPSGAESNTTSNDLKLNKENTDRLTGSSTTEGKTEEAKTTAGSYTEAAANAASGVKDSVFSMFGGGAKKEKKEEKDDVNEPSGSSKATKAAAAADDVCHSKDAWRCFQTGKD